jgi:hypothetical protein
VPQQQRLTQASLVCRAWAPAAAQATVHVERKLEPDPDAIAAMETWLAVHAGQLLSLDVSISRHILDPALQLQLPLGKLTKLQHLQLQGFHLQLPGEGDSPHRSADTGSKGSSSDGSSHAVKLSSLQRLQLKSVDLADISSLLQLTQAPHLTSLVMEGATLTKLPFNRAFQSTPAESVQQVADAMPRLLQQLPQLSVLHMPGFPFAEAAVQQTAAMTRLQQLTFQPASNLPGSSLQHLPSSITQLCLHGHSRDDPHSFSLPPQLPQLSGLRHLYLENCAVPPMVLGSVTQLQVLHLLGGSLLPHAAKVPLDAEATAALLGVLPKLTNLQDLKLHVEGLDTVSIAPEHFSALTASSHLKHLAIGQEVELPLPRGAVQHMFPPGRQMQFMQHLSIEALYGDPEPDEWCLDSADISCVASACPQLQELNINTCFQPGADVSALLQLPSSCTSLKVGGAGFTDEAVPVLLQLTQLKHLGWSLSKSFTDEGLEELIGFAGAELVVFLCGLSEQVCDDELSLKCDPVLVSAVAAHVHIDKHCGPCCQHHRCCLLCSSSAVQCWHNSVKEACFVCACIVCMYTCCFVMSCKSVCTAQAHGGPQANSKSSRQLLSMQAPTCPSQPVIEYLGPLLLPLACCFRFRRLCRSSWMPCVTTAQFWRQHASRGAGGFLQLLKQTRRNFSNAFSRPKPLSRGSSSRKRRDQSSSKATGLCWPALQLRSVVPACPSVNTRCLAVLACRLVQISLKTE